MNAEKRKCPWCDGTGRRVYRDANIIHQSCHKCEGTGRIAETRESNAERVRCSAWLGELEAARATAEYDWAIADIWGDELEKVRLEKRMDEIEQLIDTERRRSPSEPSSETADH